MWIFWIFYWGIRAISNLVNITFILLKIKKNYYYLGSTLQSSSYHHQKHLVQQEHVTSDTQSALRFHRAPPFVVRRLHTSLGITPVKLLRCRDIFSRLLKRPISVGIVPVIFKKLNRKFSLSKKKNQKKIKQIVEIKVHTS